jgi:hypothetical protein
MVIRLDLYGRRFCDLLGAALNLEEVVLSVVSTAELAIGMTAKVIGTSRTGN